jgi:GAF domain-containing protein
MASDKRLLKVLIAINFVFNDKGLELDQKLQAILHEIVRCVQAKSGSIMLMKGLKALEVVASTNVELIGVKQPLDEESPSAWVIKYRAPLYIDNIANSDIFQKRFDHYQDGAFSLVPIIVNKKVIGVLSVTDKLGEDVFSKEERKILLNIAGQVISALENQHLKRKSRTPRQMRT